MAQEIDVDFPSTQSIKQIILGTTSSERNRSEVWSYCVLHAKYYIYKQKLSGNNNMSLSVYLMELKFKLDVEKYISEWKIQGKMFEKFITLYQILNEKFTSH